MAIIRQTSFSAGELTPHLWGRNDLELYAHGARLISNFLPLPQGALTFRPGTKYLATAKALDVVLIPFIYSDTISYIIELGQEYLRIHHPDTGYTGVELAASYLPGDIQELQWAQQGTILTLTHPRETAMELCAPLSGVRTDWVFRPCSFQPPCDSETDVTRTAIQPWWLMGGGGPIGKPYLVNRAGELYVLDAAHPAREWRYKVSTLMRHKVTGVEAETPAVDITEVFDGSDPGTTVAINGDNLLVCYPDAPVLIRYSTHATPPTVPANWDYVGAAFYKGRGQLFGLVGTIDRAQDFVDVGIEPDYTLQPLTTTANPFSTYPPAAVAYSEQRRLFAGGTQKQSTVWASATDNFEDYAVPFALPTGTSPIEATVAQRKREAIRSLVPHHRTLIFTDSSVISFGGDAGLQPDNFSFRLEDEVGSQRLMPLVVDGAVLYVRTKGRGIRALSLIDSGVYQGRDVTWHAQHLFTGGPGTFQQYGRKVVSWAYAEDPWGIAWVVREDGVLLSMTRGANSQVAWAQHETDGSDRFLSIASVPSTDEDAVVVAVRRGASVYLERMSSRQPQLEVDLYSCVESAVRYEGAPTDTFTGLSHLNGRYVWVTAKNSPPYGPLLVSGGQVTTPETVAANYQAAGDEDETTLVAYIGLAYMGELELLDAARQRLEQKAVTRVGFEVDSAVGLEAGQDLEHLVPWRQRTVADSYLYPGAANDMVQVYVKGAWRQHGRAALRQSKPLPVTILGVTRELEMGEM